MRLFAILITFLSLYGCTEKINDVLPTIDHPILGAWQFTATQINCNERYEFHPNGTRTYASAEEEGESIYEISPAPLPSGFYKIKDTITNNNGKHDCAGGSTPAGDEVVIFILFNSSKEQFIMCQSESLESCFGPFTRLTKNGS